MRPAAFAAWIAICVQYLRFSDAFFNFVGWCSAAAAVHTSPNEACSVLAFCLVRMRRRDCRWTPAPLWGSARC